MALHPVPPAPPASPPLPSCSGHQSFSNSRTLNDFVGHLAHSSILVPYHGWRVSHRKHHGNHGHVENDESWHPTTKSQFDQMVGGSSSVLCLLWWWCLMVPWGKEWVPQPRRRSDIDRRPPVVCDGHA